MARTFSLDDLQHAIQHAHLDGWMLYDFRGINPLARSVMGLTDQPVGSRRWFYFVPASGEPVKVVNAIETGALDALPGTSIIYRSWREMHAAVKSCLRNRHRIAMEYAPKASNPYVSRVDAGTVELVHGFGVEVVSSGDLIQQFEARLSHSQWESHQEANRVTTTSFDKAFDFIAEQVKANNSVTEAEVQKFIMDYFASESMQTYSPPIVARQPNNRLPHYETGTGKDTDIRAGDLVMIDQWCKEEKPFAIYSDLTRMAFVGDSVPENYRTAFQIIVNARDAGIALVKEHFAKGKSLQGWEIDRTVRDVIEAANMGDYFLHRTGHSLGEEVHGNGAHLDDLEMHEERHIIPGALFTIEPGLYLEGFGVRTEVDVYIDEENQVHVTGGPVQTEILKLQ